MADEADDELSESSFGDRISASGDADCEQENDEEAEIDLLSFSADFSAFFEVNVSDQVTHLELIVDNLLGKLEEFSLVTDQIRNESKEVLFNQFPEVLKQYKECGKMFSSIDELERFVEVVKACVYEMDEKVTLAEKELGNKNLKKFLTNVPLPRFLMQKKQLQPYLRADSEVPQWTPPTKLYSTADYFPRRQRLPDLVDHNSIDTLRSTNVDG